MTRTSAPTAIAALLLVSCFDASLGLGLGDAWLFEKPVRHPEHHNAPLKGVSASKEQAIALSATKASSSSLRKEQATAPSAKKQQATAPSAKKQQATAPSAKKQQATAPSAKKQQATAPTARSAKATEAKTHSTADSKVMSARKVSSKDSSKVYSQVSSTAFNQMNLKAKFQALKQMGSQGSAARGLETVLQEEPQRYDVVDEKTLLPLKKVPAIDPESLTNLPTDAMIDAMWAMKTPSDEKVMQVWNGMQARAQTQSEVNFITKEVNAWIAVVMARRREVRKAAILHPHQDPSFSFFKNGKQITKTIGTVDMTANLDNAPRVDELQHLPTDAMVKKMWHLEAPGNAVVKEVWHEMMEPTQTAAEKAMVATEVKEWIRFVMNKRQARKFKHHV